MCRLFAGAAEIRAKVRDRDKTVLDKVVKNSTWVEVEVVTPKIYLGKSKKVA